MGELTLVIPNSSRVSKLVSDLVPDADPLTPKSLRHPQFGVEPMAGIGQVSPIQHVDNEHSFKNLQE